MHEIRPDGEQRNPRLHNPIDWERIAAITVAVASLSSLLVGLLILRR